MITEEQWQTLHALPTDPCIYDPAIAPLRNIYGLTKITRTDEQGRFQMSFRPGGELYGFVAFEENYLGLLHRKHALKPDENRYAQVPPMKLFPAATVLIEPLVEEKHVSIWPRWLIDENNNPTWVSEFLATDDRRESLFTYDRLLDPNEVHSIYVPAGLNLCIKLDTPYDRKWCPIHIPQIINLTQGEVLDLGRYIFEPAIKVSVKVTNSMGELVEGVPVRMLLDSKVWSLAHNTDETGIARFYVAPHSKGEFGVTYHGKDKVHLKESIPFQIGGEQDEGREFVLQLSDELLYQLFK